MPELRPHAAQSEALYGFSKVFVHDLDAMSRFYEEVLGLVPFNRHQDVMFGRAIDEISFHATAPGAGALTLIRFLDSTKPIRRIESFALSVAVVLDPEGHINEVVQLDA